MGAQERADRAAGFAATLTRSVAPGVHRLEHAHVNCYLIEDDTGVTVVDAAFPGTWPLIGRALRAIGRPRSSVRNLVLTHAHFDHLGFARRMREEWDVTVWAHPEEAYIAEHPYRYAHEKSRLLYPLRNPGAIPVIVDMAKAGALRVPGITGLRFFEPGQTLDVPGRPTVVFSPGHTFGHCALHLADRDALLVGDAIVTFNPYTAGVGPQIVSGAATADSARALESLSALEATGATLVLPGHGSPWRTGIGSAVGQARATGRS
jgi:glyoxylase-like metal-dependent hydrolase (beta-lactamase superfamily II)